MIVVAVLAAVVVVVVVIIIIESNKSMLCRLEYRDGKPYQPNTKPGEPVKPKATAGKQGTVITVCADANPSLLLSLSQLLYFFVVVVIVIVVVDSFCCADWRPVLQCPQPPQDDYESRCCQCQRRVSKSAQGSQAVRTKQPGSGFLL